MKFSEGINLVNYRIDKILEIEPDIYQIIYKKNFDKKSNEDEFLRHCIVDARKDEQSALVREFSLPFELVPNQK